MRRKIPYGDQVGRQPIGPNKKMIRGTGKVLDRLPLDNSFRSAAANLHAPFRDEKFPRTQEGTIFAGDNAPSCEEGAGGALNSNNEKSHDPTSTDGKCNS